MCCVNAYISYPMSLYLKEKCAMKYVLSNSVYYHSLVFLTAVEVVVLRSIVLEPSPHSYCYTSMCVCVCVCVCVYI